MQQYGKPPYPTRPIHFHPPMTQAYNLQGHGEKQALWSLAAGL